MFLKCSRKVARINGIFYLFSILFWGLQRVFVFATPTMWQQNMGIPPIDDVSHILYPVQPGFLFSCPIEDQQAEIVDSRSCFELNQLLEARQPGCVT